MTAQSEEREMPSNAGAERAVLGAILIGGLVVFDRVFPIVKPADFRKPETKAIYSAIVAMEGKGVALLTLVERLRSTGDLEKVGGAPAVAALVDGVPDMTHVERYARMVRDEAIRRFAIDRCRQLEAAAFSGEPISDLAAAGALAFSDVAADRDSGPVSIRDVAMRTETRLEMLIASGDNATGVLTGLSKFDAYTLGLQRGVLSLAGARPGVGKTALAIAISRYALAANQRVMFVQLDMSEAMFGNRWLAASAGVSSFKIRSGRFLTPEDMKAIARASSATKQLGDRLLLEYKARDIAQLAAYVRRAKRSGGLDLLIVDHIGHVRGGQGEKRYLQVGDVSARLIELAGETDAAALALVQLGRDAADRAPALSDLRESGNLEQDARLVVMLDRPHMRGEKGANDCHLSLLVLKNEGETGTDLSAHFDLRIQRITESREGLCAHCAPLESAKEQTLFASEG